MDKKSIVGFALIGLILFGYSWYQGKQAEKARAAYNAQQRELFVADSIDRAEHPEKYIAEVVAAEQAEAERQAQAVAAAEQEQKFNQTMEEKVQRVVGKELVNAKMGEERLDTLENDVMSVVISSYGGKVKDVTLKEYRKYADNGDGDQVKMFDPESAAFDLGFYLRRGYEDVDVNTSEYYFTTSGVETIENDGKQAQRLALQLPMDEDSYLEFVYTMYEGDYMLDFDVNFVGMEEWMANSTMLDLKWNNTSYQNERGFKNENMYTTLSYYFEGEKSAEKLGMAEPGKRGSRSERVSTSFKWFAFQQQFFSTIVVAPKSFSGGELGFETLQPGSGYVKDFSAAVSVPFDSKTKSYNFKVYYGPNKFSILDSYDMDLEKVVQIGGWLIRWVNRWIVIPVFNFLGNFIGNYGLIILLLTIFIKLLIFPLTYKSMMSSVKMRAIRPEIEAIQAKYPNAKTDQQEMLKSQQATMELYKKCGVSPMGGCLPMLIQFPVLIAMFRFFPTAIELRGESFLWMKDLSTYDSVVNLPFSIPWYGDHVSLMALIMALTLFFYTKLTYKEQAGGQQMAGMKFMMLYLMPIMMLMWMNNYASGLCYYYFVSQILTIIINYAFRYGVNEQKLRDKMLALASVKGAAKKSKWQMRLEEARKQQEQMAKERERRQYRSKR